MKSFDKSVLSAARQEICRCSIIRSPFRRAVAPHAGAWIETILGAYSVKRQRSRPTRARGLKRAIRVVPGVEHGGRAPRGRVD